MTIFINRLRTSHTLFASFGFAFAGIRYFFTTERNMRIHLTVAVIVIVFGALVGLSRWEWIALIIAIGLVFMAEIVNTIVERCVDLIHPHIGESAKNIKDLCAAAVLIAAVISVVIGIIVFLPYVRLGQWMINQNATVNVLD